MPTATATSFRPMLAAQKYRKPQDLWTPLHEQIVLEHIRTDGYLIVQPKIDGFRVMCHQGIGRSRTWTPWTNKYLQQWVADNHELVQGWDGEMVPGLEYTPETFRKAMSGLRAEDGAKEFTYYLFDNFDPSWSFRGYEDRHIGITNDAMKYGPIRTKTGYKSGFEYTAQVIVVPNYPVKTLEELYAKEREFLEAGWEGAIARRRFSTYKYGRATALGGELTKIKRFIDFEAVIIDTTEAMENQNELTESALGYAKRSSHQANLVGKGYIGAFICHRLGDDPSNTFRVGVFKGWTHDDRRALYAVKETLPGRIIKCREQAAAGGYDAARTPIFDSFRDPIDL